MKKISFGKALNIFTLVTCLAVIASVFIPDLKLAWEVVAATVFGGGLILWVGIQFDWWHL